MFDLRDIQLKPPFNMMVAGPSGSGKTVFVRNLIEHHKFLILLGREVIKVVWCYGQWQAGYLNNVQNAEVEYISGLVNDSDLDERQPDLLVIDDLMNELGDNAKLGNMFTKVSHHKNISVIFITQNVFHQGKQMRNMHLSCHYLVLMKNNRDRVQVDRIGTQMKIRAALSEAYMDATRDPYSYLLIDFKPETKPKFMLRARIFPDKNIKGSFSPIIYEVI